MAGRVALVTSQVEGPGVGKLVAQLAGGALMQRSPQLLQTTQYLSSPAELDLFRVKDWICLFGEWRICEEEEEEGLVLQ